MPSNDSIAFRAIQTITTIWGICFRSNSNLSISNRWSSDTVLAYRKELGVGRPLSGDATLRVGC